MEEQSIELTEFVEFVIYLGSITFFLGLLYQAWMAFRQKRKITFKAILLIVITRLLTICSTVIIWSFWITGIDIMFGPVLLPGLIAEIIWSPLMLKLFRYRLIHQHQS
jgi:hypothetical protein